jgi:hypothetical protein
MCKLSDPIPDLLQQELNGYNLYLTQRTFKNNNYAINQTPGSASSGSPFGRLFWPARNRSH